MEISSKLITAAEIDAGLIAAAAEKLDELAFIKGGNECVQWAHARVQQRQREMDTLKALQETYKELVMQ